MGNPLDIRTKLGRPFADQKAQARLVRVSITISAQQLEWLRRNGNTSAEVRRLVQAAQTSGAPAA